MTSSTENTKPKTKNNFYEVNYFERDFKCWRNYLLAIIALNKH